MLVFYVAIMYVSEIYKQVDEIIINRDNKEHMHVEMLALTLHQITHKFDEWSEKNKLKNITLDLYHLRMSFIKDSPDIDTDWELSLLENIKSIHKYIERNKESLELAHVDINLIPYNHLPAVNGFRIDRNVFITISSWDQSHNLKKSDNKQYIKIDSADNTRLAVFLKRLFENWLSAAKKRAGEIDQDLHLET